MTYCIVKVPLYFLHSVSEVFLRLNRSDGPKRFISQKSFSILMNPVDSEEIPPCHEINSQRTNKCHIDFKTIKLNVFKYHHDCLLLHNLSHLHIQLHSLSSQCICFHVCIWTKINCIHTQIFFLHSTSYFSRCTVHNLL